jgi:hypothetical protein
MQFCVTKSNTMYSHMSQKLSQQVTWLYFVLGIALCTYGAVVSSHAAPPVQKEIKAANTAETTVYVYLFQ